jgi:hypothetical protein
MGQTLTLGHVVGHAGPRLWGVSIVSLRPQGRTPGREAFQLFFSHGRASIREDPGSNP